jgi:hypothetical protein
MYDVEALATYLLYRLNILNPICEFSEYLTDCMWANTLYDISACLSGDLITGGFAHE